MRFRSDLGIVLLLALLGSRQALAAVDWSPDQTSLALSNQYAYACAPSRLTDRVDPATVRSDQLRLQHRPLHLGYLVQQSCWSEIQINLLGESDRVAYLEHGGTQVDVMQVFHSHDGVSWMDLGRAGNDIPAEEFPVHYRAPTFEIKLRPGLNTIRIFQTSVDITVLNWKLWDPKTFHGAVNWENILFGGFFAICFALSLYNLVIYAVTREVLHLYYFLYLSIYGWAQMFLVGITKLHIMTDAGPLLGRLGLSSVSIGIFFTFLFIEKMLNIRTFPKAMWRLYALTGILSLCNVLTTSLGPFGIAAQICLTTAGLGSILVLAYGAYAWKRRHPMAPLFMLAWTLLLVGNIVQVLTLAGFVEDTPLTRSANFIGGTVEAILISYALASKMRNERIDETRRRQHAYSQLEKMVYPHQLSLMKQGRQLEETMPLATGHACVLCVDMVNSSKQDIDELKDFLRCFFDECDAIMNRGYIDGGMQAYGFRIKEMGDGFLCSIGFPFVPPSHLSLPEIALNMAFDFVDKFEEALRRHPFRGDMDPVLSIGIAEGPIEGFFTLAGIRSYELFGKGIMLATRYETLRKIYPMPGRGHLICLKSTVREGLPPSYQKDFVRFDLDKSRQFIRDDETAQDFYYQRIGSAWRRDASA